MDKNINITLNLNKEQTRFIRRTLDRAWSRLQTKLQEEPNEYAQARLELQMNDIRLLENEIFFQELQSEAELG